MTRSSFAFALALALFGTMLASPTVAQVRGDKSIGFQGGLYSSGTYDRAVNGSEASTPGHN